MQKSHLSLKVRCQFSPSPTIPAACLRLCPSGKVARLSTPWSENNLGKRPFLLHCDNSTSSLPQPLAFLNAGASRVRLKRRRWRLRRSILQLSILWAAQYYSWRGDYTGGENTTVHSRGASLLATTPAAPRRGAGHGAGPCQRHHPSPVSATPYHTIPCPRCYHIVQFCILSNNAQLFFICGCQIN